MKAASEATIEEEEEDEEEHVAILDFICAAVSVVAHLVPSASQFDSQRSPATHAVSF